MKKTFVFGSLITFVVIICIFIFSRINHCSLVPISETKLYDYKEVIKMYDHYKTQIEGIRKILFSNSGNEWWKDGGDGTIFCYSDISKDNFSQSEWSKIRKFFLETGPYSIRRYSDSAIQIVYINRNMNPSDSFQIYYLPPESNYEYHARLEINIEKLNNDWYLGFNVSSVDSNYRSILCPISHRRSN